MFILIFIVEFIGKLIREKLIDLLNGRKILKNLDVMTGFTYDEATLFSTLAFMLYKEVDEEFLDSALEISYTKEFVPEIYKLYKDKVTNNLQLMEDVITDSFFARIARV